MLSVVLALASAVAYGASDFFGGLASRRVEALRVILVSYPVSAVLILVAAPFVGGGLSLPALLWGSASGVATALAIWWFYIALAEGPMSVVSPVTAVLVVVIPVIAGVLFGERPTPLAFGGIALAVVAIALVSREGTQAHVEDDVRRFTARVARITVGAGVLFGLSFVFTHQMPADGGLWPLAVARIVAALVVIGVALRRGHTEVIRGSTFRLAIAIGLLDVVANVAMLYAFQTGLLSLASVVISLYPAITVGLAIGVVRERVVGVQIVGMVLAVAAILVIALAG
ncbi:EamA family transporter [Microbacterium sp. HMH0099]|uniref:EamA family transporter n=1 Tax=Microbacterium sp. HMH0099 TaxID=3414026 RepID=UPI003BF6E4A6